MKTESPRISVVMPVYNAAKYLDETLASLLIQTFTDFEILAINDGSADNSLEILERYQKLDPRLRIITQPNSGIVKVLNRGIEEAKADYIARMDSDDVCFPERFAHQVEILNENPEVVLVAGDFEVIDEESEFLYRDLVLSQDEDLKRALFLRNPVAHGSVMLRKAAVKEVGGYSDKVGPTEDYDLWIRLAKVGKFAATASPVYKWRMNRKGITLTNNRESLDRTKKHVENMWVNAHPDVLSRAEVMRRATFYYKTYEKHGPHYKLEFLNDTSQVAAKLFTHGRKGDGLKQLLIVASTGRTGLGVALRRLHLVGLGKYNQLRRISRFGSDISN